MTMYIQLEAFRIGSKDDGRFWSLYSPFVVVGYIYFTSLTCLLLPRTFVSYVGDISPPLFAI